MKRKNHILTAVFLAGNMGIGANALFAQSYSWTHRPKTGTRNPAANTTDHTGTTGARASTNGTAAGTAWNYTGTDGGA